MKTMHYNRAEIKIDLDALKHNLDQIEQNLPEDTPIMAMVKADGYGHGASNIAVSLEAVPYIWGYGVATVEEGVILRKEGIQKPILVFGATFPSEISKSVTYNLSNNIFEIETARRLSVEAGLQRKTIAYHLSIDTGMSRLGFGFGKNDIDDIVAISQMPNLRLDGMFTHFARADEWDEAPTRKQIELYWDFVAKLKEHGVESSFHHMANSAGAINMPQEVQQMVRAGISMYGIYPSEEVYRERVDLEGVLTMQSKVIFVKDIPAGTPVSYGGTFVTTKQTRVATIPIGYGDGYPRELSNKGEVLIRGQRAKVLGRVCMDLLMVDVSHIVGVEIGDIVTLIGRDGDEEITVSDIADLSGRFSYEIVCDLTKRIPRTYFKDHQRIANLDYFYV